MSRFLDTRGNSTLGIALCARCSMKFPLGELHPDPNYPGLMVCFADLDLYDPYRLPARQAEVIVLPFVRPDDPLTDIAVLVRYLVTQDAFPYITQSGQNLIPE